jgi:hypothetical protein
MTPSGSAGPHRTGPTWVKGKKKWGLRWLGEMIFGPKGFWASELFFRFK